METVSGGTGTSADQVVNLDDQIDQVTRHLHQLLNDKRIREDERLLRANPFRVGDQFSTPHVVGDPLTVTAVHPRSLSAFDPRLGRRVRVALSIAIPAA